MREIKFRILDENNNIIWFEFIEDGRWKWNPIHAGEKLPELTWNCWKKWSREQYTWLKDKNLEDIYEGDMVEWRDWDYKHPSNPRKAIVKYDPELCFFCINYTDTGKWTHKFWFSNFIYKDTEKYIEIISNIHKNPELTK